MCVWFCCYLSVSLCSHGSLVHLMFLVLIFSIFLWWLFSNLQMVVLLLFECFKQKIYRHTSWGAFWPVSGVVEAHRFTVQVSSMLCLQSWKVSARGLLLYYATSTTQSPKIRTERKLCYQITWSNCLTPLPLHVSAPSPLLPYALWRPFLSNVFCHARFLLSMCVDRVTDADHY